MSISQFLQEVTTWLAWSGLGLGILTIIAFLIKWGAKFRLVGATIFTLLLSGSCWAFQQSYTPPVTVEGAMSIPVVYDNGGDLVVAQATEDFPKEAIKPTLEQIAGNLKGGGRNGSNVTVRIRKLEAKGEGLSQPVILGEVTRDSFNNVSIPIIKQKTINPLEIDFSNDDIAGEQFNPENDLSDLLDDNNMKINDIN
ncbi:Ycf51 family protein [Prochlorococcus marinus]|uniref:Ycf51 family protein n=1 Tax=Prochlorococcus marinus TaxID=1219 RepID=UPI002FBD920C